MWPSPGVCINEMYADTILSSFNTFSEAVIAALPIPVLFQLRMKWSQRWAVFSLLSLGFLVAVVGSVRTYYVWYLFHSDDLTWYAEQHWICAEVEICVAIVSSASAARFETNEFTRYALVLLRYDLFLAISRTISELSLMSQGCLLRKSVASRLSKAAAIHALLSNQSLQILPHRQRYFYLGLLILKVLRLMASDTLSISLLEIPAVRNGV